MSWNVSKRRLAIAAALVAGFVMPGSAFGDVSDFLGNWVNDDKEASAVARVVVTRTGEGRVDVRVFGRCQPTDCDWGVRQGHVYSNAPDSSDARRLTADFDTGSAREHLTLRPAAGGALSFDALTDFTDSSGRKDYAASGRLISGAPPRVALEAAPVSAPVSVPSASSAPPAPPDESFSDRLTRAVGLSSTPAAAAAMGEDCHVYNPVNGFVMPSGGGWNFVDLGVTLVKFGADKVAAFRSAQIISAYHFDEQCVDSRYHPKMMYWKSAGVVPHDSRPAQDCMEVNPKAVTVASTPDGWKVVDGASTLFDYGDDKPSAELTASVIRTYRLNRQCFVGGRNGAMRYWLSQ